MTTSYPPDGMILSTGRWGDMEASSSNCCAGPISSMGRYPLCGVCGKCCEAEGPSRFRTMYPQWKRAQKNMIRDMVEYRAIDPLTREIF